MVSTDTVAVRRRLYDWALADADDGCQLLVRWSLSSGELA
jgi:hypothetical protein